MQLSVSFLSGVLFFLLFRFFPFATALFFLSVAAVLISKRKLLLVLFVAIGIFYASSRYSPAEEMSYPQNKALRMTGRFTQGNAPQTERDLQNFVADTVRDEDSGEELDGLEDKEFGLRPDFPVDYDERYDLLIETGRDRTRLNPGQQVKGRWYGKILSAEDTEETSAPLFDVFDRQRTSLNRYLSERFNTDSAALISAMTTGDKGNLDETLRDAFNDAGLAHILSISGTHFGLFSVMLFGVFVFLTKRLPYRHLQKLTIYLTPSQTAALLCMPFMIMYLGISGGSIPAIRSFIMISLFLCGLLIDRKGFWLHALLFAAVVLVLENPAVITSLSFQLSFTAVLFIGFSLEKKEPGENVAVPGKKSSRVIGYLKKAALLSAVASLGTTPLAAYYFHYVSLVSPISNLLVVPLIGFVLIPLALLSSFSYIFSGHYIFAPLVAASSALSLALVKFLAGMPYAAMRVPAFPPILCLFFYTGFFLYLATGRHKKMLALPFIPFFVYIIIIMAGGKNLSVTFVDVGQGDSAVIELPDRKTIVVDTGRTGKETAAFLRYQGKRDIDALVLTHSHPDHTGGMGYLMKKCNVHELWDNGRISYPAELHISAKHRMLERGDSIETAAYSLTVLHPYKGFYTLSDDQYSEENSSSLVLRISGKAKSILLAGDIEEEAEEDIVHLKQWLPSDVIKIPHHGSRTSDLKEFLFRVSPSIAIISVGRDNSFGHPSREVLQKLEGKRIFRTDLDGAIKITEKGKDLLVNTCREFMFQEADDFRTEKGNIKKLFSVW